jgi:hypothetical protein
VEVKISLNSSNSIKGELLFLQEDTLYAYVNNQVYAIQSSKIARIEGIGFIAKGRSATLIVSGIAGIAVSTQIDHLQYALPVAGVSALGLLSGIKGFKKYKIDEPFTEEQKKKIRSYCRYPQGLTKEQYAFLIGEYTMAKPLIVIE